MGAIELNMFERTLLYLSLPILLPVLGTLFVGAMAVNQIQKLTDGAKDMLSGSSTLSDRRIERDQVQDYVTVSNSYHSLYRYATDGDNNLFIGAVFLRHPDDDENERIRILSQVSQQKNTFLHLAASHGNSDLALDILSVHPKLLLEQNNHGDTALHVAAKEGNSFLVDKFGHVTVDIENGNGIPLLQRIKNNDGNTALHEALINSHEYVAEILIRADHMVCYIANKEDKSPLYLAAEQGYVKLVKLIKEKADEINMISPVCEGKSPVYAAILSQNREILGILLSMGATGTKPNDRKGRTPLHCAASRGYIEGIRILLDLSTEDTYQPDNGGVFPIHTAASKSYVNIIKEFVRRCPDSKELLNGSDQNILHVAAKCGRNNAVKYMLKNRELRKLINQRDHNGETPLHLAAKNRHPTVVSTLTWNKTTKLNIANNEGFTAIDLVEGNMEHYASFHGRLTWLALTSAGAQRAEHLHVLLRKKEQNNQTHIQLPAGLQLPSGHDQLLSALSSASQVPTSDNFKDRVNTLLVVATLVATVTFAAGFTMPGGYNNSEPNTGMATMLTSYAFQAFVICDTIAMYTSIIVAVTLIWAQLGDLNLVSSALRLALPLLGLALTMMSLAFTAGVYLVVSHLRWLAILVFAMGMVFLVSVLVLFTPLFFPSSSSVKIIRYITYYPFRLAVLASGNYEKDLEE